MLILRFAVLDSVRGLCHSRTVIQRDIGFESEQSCSTSKRVIEAKIRI